MAAIASQDPLTPYEVQRARKIAENRARLAELGVVETARDLMNAFRPAAATKAAGVSKPRTYKPRVRARRENVRRSRRLAAIEPEIKEPRDDPEDGGAAGAWSDYEDDAPLKDLLACDSADVPEGTARHEVFQETRCQSVMRGSIYDSAVGITCHFCRQKKLCGEDNCPRCSRRDADADCIGKTDCSRCHSATGRFCRACLSIRYGQEMEVARAEMAAGAWLCPHCYEDEHPSAGWMCNSSICMTRRGYKPTGIAIYDAQQRGFKSVAHWLQAQLKKEGGRAAVLAAGAEGGRAEGSAAGGSQASATAAAAGAAAVNADDAAPARGGRVTRGRGAAAAAGGGKENAGQEDKAAAAAANAPVGGRATRRLRSTEEMSGALSLSLSLSLI